MLVVSVKSKWFLLSGQRSSPCHHRCVTPLYRIPMWIFDCVIDFQYAVKALRRFDMLNKKIVIKMKEAA